MFREFLGFGGSTIAHQASRVLSGLAAAAILGPLVWGEWYTLNLILVYGVLTQLGALNGMNREVPAALGRGDDAAAADLQRTALAVLLTATGTASVILLLVGAVLPSIVPLRELALMLLLLGLHQTYEYASTALKATIRFGALARLQLLSAIAFPAFAVSGAIAFGLVGFVAGQATTYGVLIAAAVRYAGVRLEPRMDRLRARALVAIGFPIMLVGLVFAFFSTVDRWVVLAFLGREALGHYSLAILTLGAASLLPNVVAQQYYPRLAGAWAARRDTDELRSIATQVRNMTFASVVPMVAALLIAMPPLIGALLPAYRPGIPALVITAFVPLVGAFGQGYGGVLHMLNRQTWLLGAILASVGVNVGLSVVLVTPYGLAGVALATLSAFAFYSVARVALGSLALRIEARTAKA